MKTLQENMRRFKTKNLNEQEIDYSIHPDTGKPINLPADQDDGTTGYENLQPGDKIEGRLSDDTLLELRVIKPEKNNSAGTMIWYKTTVISIQNRDDDNLININDPIRIMWYVDDPLDTALIVQMYYPPKGSIQLKDKYGPAVRNGRTSDHDRMTMLKDIKIKSLSTEQKKKSKICPKCGKRHTEDYKQHEAHCGNH